MRTSPALRGRFYPDLQNARCEDYALCPVTTMCSEFSPNRYKCLECHRSSSLITTGGDEDRDLKLMAQLYKVEDRHRLAVHQLELLTGSTMADVERTRLGRKG